MVLILVGIGIVVAPLLRLRQWLQKAPPGPEANEKLEDLQTFSAREFAQALLT